MTTGGPWVHADGTSWVQEVLLLPHGPCAPLLGATFGGEEIQTRGERAGIWEKSIRKISTFHELFLH